jgi:hypothetical protein
MAFEEISKLLKADGMLVFEGECLRFYCEDETGTKVENERIRELANSNISIALSYAYTFQRG